MKKNNFFIMGIIFIMWIFISVTSYSQNTIQLSSLGKTEYNGHYLNVGQQGKVSMTDRKSASGTYWKILTASNGSIQLKNMGNGPYKGYYMNVLQEGEISMTERKSATGTYWTRINKGSDKIQLRNEGISPFKGYYLKVGHNGKVGITEKGTGSGSNWKVITKFSMSQDNPDKKVQSSDFNNFMLKLIKPEEKANRLEPQVYANNINEYGCEELENLSVLKRGPNNSTIIRFINNTRETVSTNYIQSNGELLKYSEIPSGGAQIQHTYTHHFWMVKSASGNCLAIFQNGNTQQNDAFINTRTKRDNKTQTEIPVKKETPGTIGTKITNPAVGCYALFNDPREPTRQDAIINEIKTFIDNTPKSGEIRAGLYSFTHNDVRKALIRAAERGVNIKIAIDKFGEHNYDNHCGWGVEGKKNCINYSDVSKLEEAFKNLSNASIVRCSSVSGQACISDKQGIQHQKYFLFSSTSYPAKKLNNITNVVFVTSSNMTVSAMKYQFNDAMVMFGEARWYNNWVSNHTMQFKQIKNGRINSSGSFGLGPAGNYWTVYFSPNNKTRDIWKDRLSYAGKGNLYVNMSHFKDSRIDVARELVRISPVCDIKVLASNVGPNVKKMLEDEGIPVREARYSYKDQDGKNKVAKSHHKYMVFRGNYNGRSPKIIWFGSHNLTGAAKDYNDEVIVSVENEPSVDLYEQHFLMMWRDALKIR